MAHEKYIKRDGKIFGPYLYQNYRENGITKTRYLGRGVEKRNRKKRVNKILLFLAVFFVVLFIISLSIPLLSKGKFFGRSQDFLGELVSQSPLNSLVKLFTATSPISVFVKVLTNYPPEILNVSSEILVCENTMLDYPFSVSDKDGVSGLDVSISPPNPFYTEFIRNDSNILSEYRIWSGWLRKNDTNAKRNDDEGWAVYKETLEADDKGSSTLFSTNITIIEVNNPPKFNIGVQTINLFLKGEGANFYYDIGNYLTSQGEETPTQNLTFYLAYQNESSSPFNITKSGVINTTGNKGYIAPGKNSTAYNLKICVGDTGLLGRILHPNISICLKGNPPQDEKNKSYCDNFTLIITKENRPPNITSYYPSNLSLKVSGTDILYFNASVYDPDWDVVDVYWYIDNESEKYEEEVNFSKFEYSFGCNVGENHTIKVIATDGLLNDSVVWNISVNYAECDNKSPTGGGGGSVGKLYCEEKWGCNDWMRCGNLDKLAKEGWVSKSTELLIKERCSLLNYTTGFCGFQTRICADFDYCKTELKKPGILRECYYTENPNCTDGIKNCHNGSCEVLVDCGGACEACPTCNDGIKNQDEEEIDCGGPCPLCKELPFKPVLFKSIVSYSLIALLIVILILVIKELKEYYSSKKRAETGNIKNIIRREKKNIVVSLFFVLFVIALLFFANIYITKVIQLDRLASGVSKIREGFLATYGFINSIFNNFWILNTLPVFTIPSGTTILGYEDTLLEYDFRNNVTDPDPGDNLTIQIEKINDETNFQDYPWISLTPEGILRINSTNDLETGNFKLSMKVLDSSNEGQVMSFYFNVTPVNDAPQFTNLEDKTFNEGDLFEYIVNINDEENNKPFKFNISYVSCSIVDCNLFDNQYSFDEINGRINISFTPSSIDIGSYIINFSVTDNSSLGDKTTSVLVNFTVNLAIWKPSAILDYLLIEDENREVNLTEEILEIYRPDVTFSYKLANSKFPSLNSSFNLTTGIINITPNDADVGYNEIEIIAGASGTSSSKKFNFTITNVNDPPVIKSFTVTGADKSGLSNIEGFENSNIEFTLFADDNDFLIPQKDFYDEKLNLTLTIEGPNSTLFNFINGGLILENRVRFVASFVPRNESVGSYNITINITDNSNASDVFRFNLTVYERDYDIPNITYPVSSAEFNLKENITSNLVFRANHTIGDNLTYRFYINDSLKYEINYFGDDRNLTWQFTPNFTEETYDGEIKDLTLIVLNPIFNELNASMTWNLTINHTNCPPTLIQEIQDKGPVSYPYEFGIDLMDYFYDADYYDSHYNDTFEGILNFTVYSNVSDSKILIRLASDNWVYFGAFSDAEEELNIEGEDNESSALSNNFTVIFIPPITVPVPTPSGGGGGGGTDRIISLKIIMPGSLSAYEYEKIQIPLSLANSGKIGFNELTLVSSAFKDGNISKEVNTSLEKNYFKSLSPGQKEDLNLTVFFDTDKIGNYEVLVNVTSKDPQYTDWGKIYINLQRINESQVREIIVFTEEFIVANPQCMEIREVVKEAEKLFEKNDYTNAKLKTEEALEACKEAISQVSVPKKKTNPFGIGLYLILAILLSFIVGVAYYFLKRRNIQKMKSFQEIKSRVVQGVKPPADKKI